VPVGVTHIREATFSTRPLAIGTSSGGLALLNVRARDTRQSDAGVGGSRRSIALVGEQRLWNPAGSAGCAEGGRCRFATVSARTVQERTLANWFVEDDLVGNFIVVGTSLVQVAVERGNEERHDDVRFAHLDSRFENFAGDASAAAEPVDEGSERG
jgi:hypothetical protein